ncbi:MAG: Alpha/beta hydrolase fold-3 domain protein [Acidimicrobiales bacterium]|jgi:acetyl esterase|nr:Alpha/beta hydrolase fold-3 domain protein [Acidimicrobiales bacterium]
MRLWSDEIDALRAEARDAVTQNFAALADVIGDRSNPPADRDERVKQARAQMAKVYAPSPDAIEREIADVPCRVFVPEGRASAVYLHFHGGGMILGAPEMSDIGNADFCRRFGVAVVSVDYRLAPEHPWPAGPDDGVAVAEWLLTKGADEFGSDRVIIGGESAGGYMAAAVTLRIRDELGAIDHVDGVNLVFGVYDWGRSPSQRGIRPHAGPDILDPDGIAFFGELYLPGRTDDERRDPAVSPAFADLRNLPPALMSVGTCDHLLDDTLMLASRWAAAGNEVELFVAPDLPHGFMAFPCEITRRWGETTYRWLGERLK